MRIVAVLPSHLHAAISHRLRDISSRNFQILLISSDSAQSIPKLQAHDGLLIIQCHDFRFAQTMAAQAETNGMHYGEIALHESPFAQQYGFMVAVGGKAADLHCFTPILNALAPQDSAWWHVGYAGSAAFLSGVQSQYLGSTRTPIDFSNLFLHLNQIGAQQAYAGQLAKQFLESTDGEIFVSAHTQQSPKPLASFIKADQSPARQIAQMMVHTQRPDTTKPCI